MVRRTKELHWHIEQRLARGQSLSTIKEEFKRVGYGEDYANKLVRNYMFGKYFKKALLFSIIPWIIVMTLLVMRPGIVGHVALEPSYNYTDQVNLAINQNVSYDWMLDNQGNLTSLKLSGTISRQGMAKVYLQYESERYIIFDSSQLEVAALTPITAAAVIDIGNETNESVETNDTISENVITVNLAYKQESEYDIDNDGVEGIGGIIDYTVETSMFSWDVDYSNVCTKWEVYNEESSTFVCYGAEKCCRFIDLAPSLDSWNESFNLNYGKYGAGMNNTVAAQVIYADYSLDPDNVYSEIYYSDLDSLKAVFQTEMYAFEDVCLETCLLPNLDSNNYTLVFEIENATLNIDSISYSVIQIVNVTNVSLENATIINETLIQHKAVVNKPVKWNKIVKFSKETSPVSIEIVEEAFNVSVNKVEEERVTGIDNAFIVVDNERVRLTLYNLLQKEKKPKKNDDSIIIIEEPVEEVSIEYYTEAPSASEEIINDYKKRIVIASDIHYVDILAQTALPVEAPVESINLYWLVNGTRTKVNYSEYDTNNNSLIDYIEWIVPHLSNQTYEIEINILNVHSYPSLYGNWTVLFNTTGIANLTITASVDLNYSTEYTRWSQDSENDSVYDLRFLEIRCGNDILSYSWQGVDCHENKCSVFAPDYSCNETGYEISQVLTPERHVLKFEFGSQVVYAYNDVNVTGCTNIVSSGVYYLNESISNSTTSNCIRISANDVLLNCLNNTIDGNDVAQHGIYISRGSQTDVNITIINCTISDWTDAAIYVSNANYVTLDNVSIYSNPDIGVYLEISSNNTIVNSNIIGSDYAMYVYSSSDNFIYNNFFNNTNNFGYLISAGTSKWNTSLTLGTNIVEGKYLGGNYWATSDGGGHSVTCNDRDGNAICDETYTVVAGNVDYLPLTYPDLEVPVVNLLSPSNASVLNQGSPTFNCSITDNNWIANLTLYIWNSTGDNILADTTALSGTSNQTSWIYAFANDGNYTWNCVGYDAAGNYNWSVEGNYSVAIDRVAPVVSLISPADYTMTTISQHNFSCNITDAIEIANLTLYIWNSTGDTILTNTTGLSGRSNQTNWTYTFSYEDMYMWNCIGYDTAGNYNWSREGNYSLTYDETAPEVHLIGPADDIKTNYPLQNFSCNITDNVQIDNLTLYIWNSTGELIWNKSSALMGTFNLSNWSYSLPYDNIYSWNCIGYDMVGNNNWSVEGNYTLTLDRVAPVINLERPADNTRTNNSLQNFSCNITDNVQIDNLTLYIWNSTQGLVFNKSTNLSGISNQTNWSYSLPYDDTYNWNCIGYDTFGNYNWSVQGNYTLTYDATSPVVHLISPPNNTKVNNPEQIFSCNITDTMEIANLSLYIWNSTGDNILTNTTNLSGRSNQTSWVYNLPNDGNYTWNCLGYDNMDNYNWSVEGNYTIILDRVVPTVWLLSPADDTKTNNETQIFSCNITNAVQVANLTLYIWNSTGDNILTNTTGLLGMSNETNWTYTFAYDGNYTWNCLGYDAAGNYNWSIFGNNTLILDRVNPIVGLVIPENNTLTYNATQTFGCNMTDSIGIDNITLYIWHINGSIILTNTTYLSGGSNATNWTYKFDNYGNYSWNCLGYDIAGNYDWNIDGNYSLVYTHNISYCLDITVPGHYYLVDDIIDSTTLKCIRISADDVLLDCLGHSIDGDDSIWYGIWIERFSSTDTNITLQNCIVTDWGRNAITSIYANNNVFINLDVNSNPDIGIRLIDSNNNKISESNFNNNGDEGIYFDSSLNNTISNVTATNNNNGLYLYTSSTNTILTSNFNNNNNGIYIYSSSNNTVSTSYIGGNSNQGVYIYDGQDNSIYDNVINNSYDVFFESTIYYNAWNTTYQLGPSIINGTYMGGNYWAKPDGTGYSENCTDINADRICDNSYTVNTTNIDYLPLAAPDLEIPGGQHIAIANGTITNNVTPNFVVNATDNMQLANATLYIWNSTDDLIHIDTNIISGTFNVTSWAYTFTYDDTYLWSALICDTSSNCDWTHASPANWTFTIDTLAPVIHLVSPENDTKSNNITQTFECNITDTIWISNLSLYIWNSSGGVIYNDTANLSGTKNQSSWDYTFATDGNYSWNCIGYDIATNFNWSAEGNYTLFIDRVVPTVNLISPPNNTKTNESRWDFSCNITNAVQVANLTLYIWNSTGDNILTNTTGLLGVSNQTNWTYTFPYEDVFAWDCLGYDAAGNYNWSVQGNYTITYDETEPVVHLVSPMDDTRTNQSDQTFVCNITDNMKIANLTLYVWNSTGDNILVNTTALSGTYNQTNWTYTLPYDNIYGWNCLGYDDVGNYNWSVEGNYSLTLDRVAPEVHLIDPPDNTRTNVSNQTFNCNITDNVQIANLTLYIWNSTGVLVLNSSKNLSGTFNQTNWTYILPYDNIYGWNCLGYDTVGNYNWSVEGNYSLTLDRAGPTVNLIGPENDTKTNQSNQTFSCSINDTVQSANLSLYIWNSTRDIVFNTSTNLSGISNQTSWNYTLPYDDVYLWNCLGYDTVGNYNWSVGGNYTLTLDATPPMWSNEYTNITNSTVRYNYSIMFAINWTDNIKLDSIIFGWNGTNGGNLTNDSASYCGDLSCTRNITKIVNLTRGHQFCWVWYANDTVNNWNATNRSCLVVNNTPPTQGTPIVNSTYGTNFTYEDLYCYNQSFNDIDADSLTALYQWYEDGVILPGQNNWTLLSSSTSELHNYTCVVWAYDGFDNSTPANATIWIREGLKINITSPLNGSTVNYSYQVPFNFTVSKTSNCSYNLDDTGYVDIYNVTNYSTTFNIYSNSVHNITVNCSSGAMNASEITIFTINDTTPPNITSSSPSGTLYVTNILMTATTDENATCKYIPHTEGNIQTNYSSMPYSFNDIILYHEENLTLTNGYYEYYARCIDNLGNAMNWSENISFTIDVEIIYIEIPTSGGGGRRQKNVTKTVLLELHVPSNKTLFSADEITIGVTLKNKGEVALYNISLSTESNAPNVTMVLSNILFDKIDVGEEESTTLKIKSLVDPKARIGVNRYFVVLNAHVSNPIYDTLTRFFVDVEERDYELRMENLRQIQFAQDLFKEHPECLEFNEVINQAENSYDDYDYKESLALIESAIHACRALIMYIGDGEYEEELIEDLEKPVLLEDNTLLLIEIITLLAILLGLLYYYRKRKGRKPQQPVRVAKTNLETRFEDLFKNTRKLMRVRNWKGAKMGYSRLVELYRMMKSSTLPDYVKSDSYQKLLIVHKKMAKKLAKLRK